MDERERQRWLDVAASYTRERYVDELPDKLLRALACAPFVPEQEINSRRLWQVHRKTLSHALRGWGWQNPGRRRRRPSGSLL